MGSNKPAVDPKRKIWNYIGWGVALSPFILLAVGPDSYSYHGDSHGAGVAIFLFFLSIPSGLLVSLVGRSPKLARNIIITLVVIVGFLFLVSFISSLKTATLLK
jgi:hypothetical protein